MQFLFSQLWTTFPRKLMKRPAVSVKYFQRPFQIVHSYQVLRSEYFFQKSLNCLNLMSVFLTLKHIPRKNHDNTSCHFAHDHKFLSSKIFCKKSFCSLKMLLNYYLSLQLWVSFATKLMKRPTIFMKYCQIFCGVTRADKVLSFQKFWKKAYHSFKMLINYYSFP